MRSWRQPGFKIRSTGIAINDDRLLVHTVGREARWWALPGGGPNFQEFASATLAREMAEEIGATVRVGRLLFVIERAFTTRLGERAHHLDLAFELEILDQHLLERREPWVGPTPEEYGELVFSWEPLADLGRTVPFYPGFLVDHLRRPLPQHPLHLTSDV